MKLNSAVEIYVSRRQNAGFDFSAVAKFLQRFARELGNVRTESITVEQVTEFFNASDMGNTAWLSRYGTIHSFLKYCLARRFVRELPLPPRIPSTPNHFSPHIYTKNEVKRLVRASVPCLAPEKNCISPQTMTTFILMLYGTGMLVGEAQRLTIGDVDLTKNLIQINKTSRTRIRCIPIGDDVNVLLTRHLAARPRENGSNDCPLLMTKNGKRLSLGVLSKTFRRLRRMANVLRYDNSSYQPRMHDLRHTFAVHTIDSWHRRGLSVDRMMPLLTMYMGNVKLKCMERYLRWASVRFEPQLRKLIYTPKPRR